MNSTLFRAALVASVVFFSDTIVGSTVDRAWAQEKPDGKQYEYQEDLKRHVAVIRGKQFLMGHLDSRGNFLPHPFVTHYEVGQPFKGHEFYYINLPKKIVESVYEYRSALLVKGILDGEGNFIPAVGSTIVPFKDYRYGKDAPRIYNLPGTFVEKKVEKKPMGPERKDRD